MDVGAMIGLATTVLGAAKEAKNTSDAANKTTQANVAASSQQNQAVAAGMIAQIQGNTQQT